MGETTEEEAELVNAIKQLEKLILKSEIKPESTMASSSSSVVSPGSVDERGITPSLSGTDMTDQQGGRGSGSGGAEKGGSSDSFTTPTKTPPSSSSAAGDEEGGGGGGARDSSASSNSDGSMVRRPSTFFSASKFKMNRRPSFTKKKHDDGEDVEKVTLMSLSSGVAIVGRGECGNTPHVMCAAVEHDARG